MPLSERAEKIHVHLDRTSDPSVRKAIDDMVPWTWRDVVCGCYTGVGTRPRSEDGNYAAYGFADYGPCHRCGKVPRVFFAYCGSCRNGYITLFRHSQKVRDWGLDWYARDRKRKIGDCWTCLIGYHGQSEGDVPPPAWAVPKEDKPLENLPTLDLDIGDLTFNF